MREEEESRESGGIGEGRQGEDTREMDRGKQTEKEKRKKEEEIRKKKKSILRINLHRIPQKIR